MSKSSLYFIIAGLFILAGQSPAQTTSSGGRGMFRVFSAETVQRGSVFVATSFLTFLQTTDSRGFGNDHTLQLGLTYGLSPNLELTAKLVPYQEDQVHDFSVPGDTQFGIKWRTPFSTTSLITGLRGFIVLPTGRSHNVPFEPYSSGKLSLGAMAMITASVSQRYPLKVYANVGYLDHNITTLFSNELTDQLLLGIGFKFPIHPFIMYTEYSGEIFVNNNAVSFKDNSMRLTYGLRFRGPFRTTMDMGVDVGLSRNLNPAPHPLIHEYADWKIFAGISYQFDTMRVYGKSPVASAKPVQKDESRMLEEIKRKREQADRELEEMKKKLEEGENKPENN